MTAMRLRRAFLACALSLMVAAIALCSLDALAPIPDIGRFSASDAVLWGDGGYMFVRMSEAEEWCIPISLDEMGKWTVEAAIGIEDKRFKTHRGVDIRAVLRAALADLKSMRYAQGASTITSQLVRIAIPRERTLLNKALEFWTALKLERAYSKDEILEAWLNRVPFGSNIRGIEAASLMYFGKRASTLTLGESVSLISMLRAPSRLRPDRAPSRLKQVRDRELLSLHERGCISWEICRAALSSDISSTRNTPPRRAIFAAPHILSGVSGYRVRSTLDRKSQELIEEKLNASLRALPDSLTAAAIAVDNESGNVIAYVGNSRNGSRTPGSEYDCGAALRSPGSLLKPFVYAQAFESGRIEAMSILNDGEEGFGRDAPRNYDRSYRGAITARAALARSLNAPAVRVLRAVGISSAADALRRFGFMSITSPIDMYGDSLILGGCEITMLQAAAAYRALSNGGLISPLVWSQGSSPGDSERVISPESAYLITNILQDAAKPLHPTNDAAGRWGEISLKTGTSHGLRDAWCAASSRALTVVVWYGCPTGASSVYLKGQELAAPVAVDILRALDRSIKDRYVIPENIVKKEICVESGELASFKCNAIYAELVDVSRSKREPCRLEHRPNITRRGEVEKKPRLELISPQSNIPYVSSSGRPAKIPLVAKGSGEQYWYIDGRFLMRIKGGASSYIELFPGKYKLSVHAGDKTESVAVEVR